MSENTIAIQPKPLRIKNIGMILLGTTFYVVAVNLFLQPLNLFPGGFVGLSQVLRTLFFRDVSFDVAGIMNFLFNIPIFILVYKTMNRKMLVGTIISLIIQTILFTILHIPSQPLINDTLASIMVSGILAGVGCGMILSNGGTAGGLDLLGVYMSSKFKAFSVGKLSIIFNACLYAVCAFMFNFETALYSALWIAFFSLAIDRFHMQNIEVQMMIFTHHPEMTEVILKKHVRGVTEWEGMGSYTKQNTHILVTIISKSEEADVKKDILQIDPKAFIITNDHIEVSGGYQKRLDN